MKVAEAVGRTLAQLGVGQVFGVIGSGNFHVTNALIAGGARFIAARHENGAAMMADAYSRSTGTVSVVSLHQGCGLTNGLTGITEAAKSRSPVLVVSADTPPTQKTSNFWIDQEAAVAALGAEVERIHTPGTAVDDAVRAYQRALQERRTVLLNLPLDVQEAEIEWSPDMVVGVPERFAPGPSSEAVRRLVELLSSAERPVLVGGRGALAAGPALTRLADACGALLATSAVARGLFAGHRWNLDVIGGFATPVAGELIQSADVVVAFGASLNRWTTRNGTLLCPGTKVVQVDLDLAAIGHHRPADLGVIGDSAQVAETVAAALDKQGSTPTGYRTEEVAERLARGGRWCNIPYEDTGTDDRIDPRTLTIALNDLLPMARVVVPDGGNFSGYPAMFLDVPDRYGFCLPLAFQSIGLALPAAIGAGVAAPDRTAIAAVGDGGFMMSLTELDTAVRLALPLVVIVYNDDAYGAEVHHFGPEGFPVDTVLFPETDIAAIAQGFGCTAVAVRRVEDLKGVSDWVQGPPDGPLLIDAKITSFPSWVLAHSFADETVTNP